MQNPLGLFTSLEGLFIIGTAAVTAPCPLRHRAETAAGHDRDMIDARMAPSNLPRTQPVRTAIRSPFAPPLTGGDTAIISTPAVLSAPPPARPGPLVRLTALTLALGLTAALAGVGAAVITEYTVPDAPLAVGQTLPAEAHDAYSALSYLDQAGHAGGGGLSSQALGIFEHGTTPYSALGRLADGKDIIYRDGQHAVRVEGFRDLYALRDQVRDERIVQNLEDEVAGVGRLIHQGAQKVKDAFSQ